MLVGVNLLREGLDLPEVSLVAILDADKEGFLRGQTALIQTIGRAARNIERPGADVRRQGDRGDARRGRARPTAAGRSSSAHNEEHGITPTTISKSVTDITEFLVARLEERAVVAPPRRREGRRHEPRGADEARVDLEQEMLAAAEELRFEYAARLRDEIKELRRELLQIESAGLR